MSFCKTGSVVTELGHQYLRKANEIDRLLFFLFDKRQAGTMPEMVFRELYTASDETIGNVLESFGTTADLFRAEAFPRPGTVSRADTKRLFAEKKKSKRKFRSKTKVGERALVLAFRADNVTFLLNYLTLKRIINFSENQKALDIFYEGRRELDMIVRQLREVRKNVR